MPKTSTIDMNIPRSIIHVPKTSTIHMNIPRSIIHVPKISTIHMNIPRSIIDVPKTSNPCHILFFQLRECGTAGALVLYPSKISLLSHCGTAGLRDCGSTSSIPTPSTLFLLKYFLAHFSFLIS